MGYEEPCTHLQEREGSTSVTNQGPPLLWATHLSSVGLKQLWVQPTLGSAVVVAAGLAWHEAEYQSHEWGGGLW